MKKRIATLLLLLLAGVMIFGAFGSFAVEPYETYTYSLDGFALKSPSAYTPVRTVGYRDIETSNIPLGEFNTPTDLVVDKEGNVYLADSKNNRVIVMEGQDYKVKFTLSTFDNNGYSDSFNECRGVFVDDDYIYVCDTNNSRIVVFNRLNGDFVKIIGKPMGSLFGASTQYNPIAMAVDKYGRIFVISSTTYEGVIVMTSEGVFTGYIGAQKGNYSAFEILIRRFQTEEQRAASKKNTSTEFNNITIDSDGFIYVTTNTIDKAAQQAAITSFSADYAPVKKLNSAGAEIMKRNGFFAPGGEVDVQNFTKSLDQNVKLGASNVTDVAIGDEGTWSIVDKLRSKIFTYDQNGVLLFAFGDAGDQLGNTKTISSIAYQNGNLLVLDQDSNSFTVYRRTPYCQLLIDALKCENDRQYAASIDAWLAVLQYNNNFDSAYVGVGRAYYRQGNAYFVSEDGQSYYKQTDVLKGYAEDGTPIYETEDGRTLKIDEEYTKRGYDLAMHYLSSAYDAENWSNAYKEIRKEWISKWIILIPITVIVLVVAVTFFLKFATKFNAKVALLGPGRKTYIQELMYVFHLIFHPFDGFWDLKHEKRGSIRASITILALVILAFYYQAIGTGYVMNTSGDYSTIVAQFLSVMLPFVLWVIANWCLTTLFEGEGSFKDIFIATSYSLAPLPIVLVVSTILSNFVTFEESAIVTMLVTVGYVWAGLLIFFGMMVTHDYPFTKNLLMCVATIVGMAVIMFVGFLFSSLVGKMVSFVSSIITEISYRL